MNSSVLCITGWHFQRDLYHQISLLDDSEVFILSHKPRRRIPDFIFELFPENHVLIRKNIGYDWGCYQQFIRSGLWKGSEVVFFLHDDIQLHDLDFVDKVKSMLSQYQVIGNGRGEGSVGNSSPRNHPYAYAHSAWKPDLYDFHHPTVRGSFFALSSDDLDQLGGFEVYWDPFHISVAFGNWSTKATCGKMADIFGENSFGYLSDTFGSSLFITESVRGGEIGILENTGGIKGWLYTSIKRASRVYLELHYLEKDLFPRFFWMFALRMFITIFSGKLNLNSQSNSFQQ
jgi:hypothetical protein